MPSSANNYQFFLDGDWRAAWLRTTMPLLGLACEQERAYGEPLYVRVSLPDLLNLFESSTQYAHFMMGDEDAFFAEK